MTAGGKPLRRRAQRLVARGFAPPPEPEAPVTVLLRDPADGTWSRLSERELAAALPRVSPHGLAALCPSYVGRCGLAEHLEVAGHVLDQLAGLRRAHPRLPLVLFFGMQWQAGEEEEATRRLARIGEAARERVPGLVYVGLSLPGPGKVRTTNAAIRAAAPLRPAGWLWLDDDVRMEPGCVARLVDRFEERGRTGAVGAAKVALATRGRASRVLRRIGLTTAPRRNYPSACCMLVAAGVVAGGIPTRLGADDAYVLFELLDPAAADPFHALEVLPEARCLFVHGASWGMAVRRLRSTLFSHLMHMADYPWPTARVYFEETLFHGLWPLAPWDGRRGPVGGTLRWAVKAIHFSWFAAAGSALLVRGLLGRPLLRAPWADTSDHLVPPRPPTPSTSFPMAVTELEG
ncbi:glycosyltransferase family 2 protein [Streptomyces sp. NPDC053048]|uniref:glycosyltransferase family 2 protein n=1 Tax=Streptomyces sp. NPDC053048 TaxID=3365694 RepID=UPI0037D0CCFE